MVSRLRLVLLCTISVAAFLLFVATGSASAAGAIEGEVVEAGTSVSVEEVVVCAYQLPNYEPEFCEETNASGKYVLNSIPDGEYVVEFWAPYFGYAVQFYNDSPNIQGADEVIVNGGNVSGIDAELHEGGKMEGRVTDALTGSGIEEVEVCAFAFGVGGACELTDGTGAYRLTALGTGSYSVEFWAESLGYETVFYNQQSDPKNANSVNVVAPNTVGAIDARMSKPGSHITPPVSLPALPALPSFPTAKPRHKALKCHKGFKKGKRHGREVCVKQHKKKKHRS